MNIIKIGNRYINLDNITECSDEKEVVKVAFVGGSQDEYDLILRGEEAKKFVLKLEEVAQ